MAIRSRSSKPDEWASKINHTHIINDPFIKNFLDTCNFPKKASDINVQDLDLIYDFNADIDNPIKYILAVDGGYTTVEVQKGFPSSQIAFFQFGALLFNVSDLNDLSEKPFIFPEDMDKLQDLQRFKLVIPIKNIISREQISLTDSIRKEIHEFFMKSRGNSRFIETLSWLIFEEYKPTPLQFYTLGNSPINGKEIQLRREDMTKNYTFETSEGTIYLTDIFRLHEAIDEELGASGILGYITRLVEQLIIVYFIRSLLRLQKDILDEFLFISDGPLSFSGQTANMHKPLRELCNFIQRSHKLHFVGIEKSGAFVDHAQAICIPYEGKNLLDKGKYLILSNDYIYKYVVPGDPRKMHYGSTSYYGGKVIFHSPDDQIITLSIPVEDKNVIRNPKKEQYRNIDVILKNIQKLKCDMYDDSIVPIALANKLVSLANHPSQTLLEKFASSNLKSK